MLQEAEHYLGIATAGRIAPVTGLVSAGVIAEEANQGVTSLPGKMDRNGSVFEH